MEDDGEKKRKKCLFPVSSGLPVEKKDGQLARFSLSLLMLRWLDGELSMYHTHTRGEKLYV